MEYHFCGTFCFMHSPELASLNPVNDGIQQCTIEFNTTAGAKAGNSKQPDRAEGASNFFDLQAGKLLIGDAAVHAFIECGGNPYDIVPLHEVLKNPTYSARAGDYDLLDTGQWSLQDYLSYGHWLESILNTEGRAKTGLTERSLIQSYYHGLGPSISKITAAMRFGSLTTYYSQLEVVPKYTAREYDEWGTSDFATYVENTFLDLLNSGARHGSGSSIAKVIRARAKRGEGPSLQIINHRGGRIMQLLGSRGYADSRGWNEEEYIEWGVKFMFANGGTVPSTPALEYLAKSRRAPRAKTITAKFGSMPKFQQRVAELYREDAQRHAQDTLEKTALLSDELACGILPPEFLDADLTDTEKLSIRAKNIVLADLLPDLETTARFRLASQDSDRFTQIIQRKRPELSAGHIEETALLRNVFDDIWPFDDNYKVYLKVPEEVNNPRNLKVKAFN
jgi:hypothetical protein